MLTSVLLSSSGILVAIIVSIVVSVISARRKAKEKIASMGKSRQQRPVGDAPVKDDASFIDSSPENEPNSPISDIVSGLQKEPASSKVAQTVAAVAEEASESEYSLKDSEEAKRAIIYSEILKPKF